MTRTAPWALGFFRRLSSHSFRCRGVTASPDFTRFSNISGPPSGTNSDHVGNGPQSSAVSRFVQMKSTLFGTKPPKPPRSVVPRPALRVRCFWGETVPFRCTPLYLVLIFGWVKRPQNGLISRGERGITENGPALPHSPVTRLRDVLLVLGGCPVQAHTRAHNASPAHRLRHTAADSGCGTPGGFG